MFNPNENEMEHAAAEIVPPQAPASPPKPIDVRFTAVSGDLPTTPVTAQPTAQSAAPETPAPPPVSPVYPYTPPMQQTVPPAAPPISPVARPVPTQQGTAPPYSPYAKRPNGPLPQHGYQAQQPVYSRQYNTDRAPYYATGPAANVRGEKPRQRGAGLVVICIVVSLLFGFIGAAIEDLVLAGGTETGQTNAPVIQQVDPNVAGSATLESLADVVAATKPSVVEINTSATASYGFSNSIEEGAGSGVILSADGYILTNQHVISGAETINVILSDGTSYPATLVGKDSRTDIAILKIEKSGLSPVTFGDSSILRIGDRVIAIGNPLGSLGGTVTDGIISALDREITVGGMTMNLLQTSAAVNPGNSGGGLFDTSGKLIGIVNAKSTGEDIEGLGFAVPINTVKEIIDELMNQGYVSGRPALGITVLTIADAATAAEFGVSRYGVYIREVTPGGPADIAGLKVGDCIISVNDQVVEENSDVVAIINEYQVGDTVRVQVLRDGSFKNIDVVLGEMK